eukprot:2119837-Lingulodinium_polyedra.AAC.1
MEGWESEDAFGDSDADGNGGTGEAGAIRKRPRANIKRDPSEIYPRGPRNYDEVMRMVPRDLLRGVHAVRPQLARAFAEKFARRIWTTSSYSGM